MLSSAGGNLALSLLQALLQLQRQNTTVFWQGEDRAVPLPAGVAVNSPWVDITHSSPSCETNAAFDYLPPLNLQLAMEPKRPHCTAWPMDPPRSMMYADDDMVLHPLVSLMMAPSWVGAPPIWMCSGRELLSDEDKFMANKFWKDGVRLCMRSLKECHTALHCCLRSWRRQGGAQTGGQGSRKRWLRGARSEKDSR